MGIISDVKCSRCDRRYSGLRSRCPYCGAMRAKRGKRSSDSDNALWKFIIGILLLVVLMAAVIILLVTSLSADVDQPEDDVIDDVQGGVIDDMQDGVIDDGGISSIDGTVTDPNAGVVDPNTGAINPNTGVVDPNTGVIDPNNPNGTVTDPNAGTVTPLVETVQITYLGSPREDITMNVGEVLHLGSLTFPEVQETPEWASSDTSKLVVLQSGEVRAVAAGEVTLTVTVGGVTGECVVRVK